MCSSALSWWIFYFKIWWNLKPLWTIYAGNHWNKGIKAKLHGKKASPLLKRYWLRVLLTNDTPCLSARWIYSLWIYFGRAQRTVHATHSKERRWSKCLYILCTESPIYIGFLIQRLSKQRNHPNQLSRFTRRAPFEAEERKYKSRAKVSYIIYKL